MASRAGFATRQGTRGRWRLVQLVVGCSRRGTTNCTQNTMSTNNTSKPAAPQPQGTVKERFLALAKGLQFAWFAGHVVVLLSTFFYVFGFNGYIYRIAYLGVLHSFGIIGYQQYYLKTKSTTGASNTPSLYTLINDENVIYFIQALMWLLTPAFSMSLLPFALFSLFHVLRYVQNTLLPTVFGLTKENNTMLASVDSFTRTYNERCMYWVGTTEIAILVVLVFRALLWYPSSWIVLMTYALFIKIRYETSKYTKASFSQCRVRLDGVISHPSIPPVVKSTYNTMKLKLIDISRYQLTKPKEAVEKSN